MEQLPRLSDLVPQRVMTLALAFWAGLAVIAALLALHVRLGSALAGWSVDGRVAAFDLARDGTAAAWFSSFLLTLSSLAALALFAVGKRHVEDYHARYRAWAWAGIVFLVMSLDAVAGLRHGFRELMTHASGTRLAGDGSAWWAVGYGLVLLPLSWMIWHRTQKSWAARTYFLAAAVAFVVAAVCQADCFPRLDAEAAVVVRAGCEMLLGLCLLMGLVVHAGFSLRQLGEVKRGRRKPAAAKAPAKKKPAKKASARGSRSKAAKQAAAEAEAEAEAEPEAEAEEYAEGEAGAESEGEAEEGAEGEEYADETEAPQEEPAHRRDPPHTGRGGPPAPHIAGKNEPARAAASADQGGRASGGPSGGASHGESSAPEASRGEADEESTRYLRVDDAEDLLEEGGGGHGARNKKKEKRRQRR